MKRPLISLAGFLLLSAIAHCASAASPRIDPAGIPGSCLMFGGGPLSTPGLSRLIDLAGGSKADIIVIDLNERGEQKPVELKGVDRVRRVKLSEAKEALQKATAVWFSAGADGSQAAILKKIAPLRAECIALLNRSGVIATSGAACELLGENGLSFVAGADIWLDRKEKDPPRPGRISIDLSPDAVLQVKGRTLSSVGGGPISISLAPSKTLEKRTIELKEWKEEDLTALRRAALDRQENFPPAKVDSPVVENGTLFIIGGGRFPGDEYKRFVELSGGEGKAVIVVLPTAAADPLPEPVRTELSFRKAGAKKATVLNARTQADVESPEFLNALKEATGIWFGGGRQWRFVDCYENTKALPLMFDVLKRGGAIGGSSAGATIQGEYLCRGGVFNNFDIRYEGYERGFGFLKGVAIDQHFSQRKRQADMTSLMKIYPQYLGIGLDEGTAIVVRGSVAEVEGAGKAFFYDAARKRDAGEPDYESIAAGRKYDLKQRKVMNALP